MTYALPLSESSKVDARHWLAAFAVAAALHAAAFLQWPDRDQNSAKAPGVGGSSVSIAMTASRAGVEHTLPEPTLAETIPVDVASPRIPVVPAASSPATEATEESFLVPPPPAALGVDEIVTPAIPAEDAIDVVTGEGPPPELVPMMEPTPDFPAEPVAEISAQPRPPLRPLAGQTETVDSMRIPAPAIPTKSNQVSKADGPPAVPASAWKPHPISQVAPTEKAALASGTASPVGYARVPDASAGSMVDAESSTGGAATLTPFTDYAATLRDWLERHKDYPKLARRKRMQGSVLLYFRFGRDGKVLAQEIRKTSGYWLLDDAALEMLARAAPLPDFPHEMSGDYLDVVLPIEYSLAGKN